MNPAEYEAAVAACPEPIWHTTHRYCPVCPWTESGPDHGKVDRRAGLAVERSAVIGAARRFLAAHDRVIGSDPTTGVTRDDSYAMSRAADDLREVLRLHDENASRWDQATGASE